MFNTYFNSVFNFHQCSVSNERMIVMTTGAILLLQTDLNIRTIAHSRPILSIDVFIQTINSCNRATYQHCSFAAIVQEL